MGEMKGESKPFPTTIRLVSYLAADHWINAIWGAVNGAEEEARIPTLSRNQRLKMRNLGLSVTLKREFVQHLIKLLEPQLSQLKDFLNEAALPDAKFAIPIPTDVRNNILVFVDALLFELKSVVELTVQVAKFCLELTSLPRKKCPGWVEIRFAGWWREQISSARNLYTHQSAPYFDLDFDHVPDYDLLFTVKHPEEPKTPHDYIRLSDIVEATKEMFNATMVLRKDLIDALRAHGV